MYLENTVWSATANPVWQLATNKFLRQNGKKTVESGENSIYGQKLAGLQKRLRATIGFGYQRF